MTNCFACLILFIGFSFPALSQDTIPTQIPSAYFDEISSKTDRVSQKLDKQSEKTLRQLMKQEARMKKKLAKIDPKKAEQVFGDADQRYAALQQKLENKLSPNQYIPSLDTLSSSLKFLGQNQQLISSVKEGKEKWQGALDKVNGLEDRFQKAEEIRRFMKERKQFLKDQLGKLGFAKELKKLNKQVYYYNEQLNEYKALLKDHKKAERKAVELLSRTKLFRDFMRKNSMLASLFRLPSEPGDPNAQIGLAGLQTRAQVNNLIQEQIAAGGPGAMEQFRQNMQEAQSRVNELKNMANRMGRSSDAEMPEGFKPNNQKTKSFFRRLEYGANIQTQKATNFFPVTSDIGLSIGYKLNDKSIIGIGASYKMGLGRGWNNIQISNQGLGIRSFIDWKILSPKGGAGGGLWMSGGYEKNYKTAFSDFSQLRNQSAWQTSGLLGLSKVISLKTKFLKQTRIQLLFDFLSYQQIPRTQPLLVRVGYNF